jgi:hypothetical protein
VFFVWSSELRTEDPNWLTRVMAADVSDKDRELLLFEVFRSAGVGQGVMGTTRTRLKVVGS